MGKLGKWACEVTEESRAAADRWLLEGRQGVGDVAEVAQSGVDRAADFADAYLDLAEHGADQIVAGLPDGLPAKAGELVWGAYTDAARGAAELAEDVTQLGIDGAEWVADGAIGAAQGGLSHVHDACESDSD